MLKNEFLDNRIFEEKNFGILNFHGRFQKLTIELYTLSDLNFLASLYGLCSTGRTVSGRTTLHHVWRLYFWQKKWINSIATGSCLERETMINSKQVWEKAGYDRHKVAEMDAERERETLISDFMNNNFQIFWIKWHNWIS